MMSIYKYASALLLLGLLFTVFYYQTSLDSVNSKLTSCQESVIKTAKSLHKCESESTNLHSQLKALSSELAYKESEIASLTAQLEDTQRQLDSVKKRVGDVLKEIDDYQDELDKKMIWLRDNSMLTESLYHTYLRDLDRRCEDDGYLNLGCVAYVLSEYKGVEYVDDPSETLRSLEEFLGEGGDCEDYSLFMKAYLNYLRERKGYYLLGWKEGNGEFPIYETSEALWYYDNAERYNFGRVDKLYPVGICYVIDSTLGHCVVALSDEAVNSIDDLSNLDNADVLEPQTGEYLGSIGDEFHLCDFGDLCTSEGDIDIVIMDSDILYFDSMKGWIGYGYYGKKLDELKTELDQMR